MATDDYRFRIRPGKVRDRGATRLPRVVRQRPKTFIGEVHQAIRRAGGNPNRLAGTGKGSGRFNARGRGAAVAAGLKNRNGWSRDGSGARSRSRRVAVKARVVKLNPQRGATRGRQFVSGKAVAAHLRYLERDGVTRDGEKGQLYSAERDVEDGRAFLDRGREDRHQFRFIVSAEEGVELSDLRQTTRVLMTQMESDLGTRLDWVAVDHHNTGYPHTHILMRGVTDDGKILNIAGDYIAHGIRERASDIVTQELGRQTEQEVTRQLESEVHAERFTRLDRMLIAAQQEHEFSNLRPDKDMADTMRRNRALLIDRARHLERMNLAAEIQPGIWTVYPRAEGALRELGERNDVIKTMHRALADNGLTDQRGVTRFVRHGETVDEKIVGRVLAKGLAGDQMGERVYLVVDGVDGRVHHMEFGDPARIDEVRRDMIVEAAPAVSGPRSSDRNIAIVAEDDGFYRPSRHLERIRESFAQQGKDSDAFVRFHVRRLEALRRAGHVERIDEDHWRIPKDIVERGQAHDLSQGGDSLRVRTLSTLDLERQIGSDGATWLDRELVAREHLVVADFGFGGQVNDALDRRAQRLVEMGHATVKNGMFSIPRRTVAALERVEIEHTGKALAAERGRQWQPAVSGNYVAGTLVGSTQLASGRFAMIDDGLGFSLVPWRPALEQRLGRHISGVAMPGGGVDWSFGRQRGLGL